MESIMREKKILMNLPENNHTIKYFASFESTYHFNFLIEYCPGGELYTHLKDGKLSERVAKACFSQVTKALEFLHQNNILYRDLKVTF